MAKFQKYLDRNFVYLIGSFLFLMLFLNKGAAYWKIWVGSIPLFITEAVMILAGLIWLINSALNKKIIFPQDRKYLIGFFLFFGVGLVAVFQCRSEEFTVIVKALKRSALFYYSFFSFVVYSLIKDRISIEKVLKFAYYGSILGMIVDLGFTLRIIPDSWPTSVGIAQQTAKAYCFAYSFYMGMKKPSLSYLIFGSLAIGGLAFTNFRTTYIALLATACAVGAIFLLVGKDWINFKWCLKILAGFLVVVTFLFVSTGPPLVIARSIPIFSDFSGLVTSLKIDEKIDSNSKNDPAPFVQGIMQLNEGIKIIEQEISHEEDPGKSSTKKEKLGEVVPPGTEKQEIESAERNIDLDVEAIKLNKSVAGEETERLIIEEPVEINSMDYKREVSYRPVGSPPLHTIPYTETQKMILKAFKTSGNILWRLLIWDEAIKSRFKKNLLLGKGVKDPAEFLSVSPYKDPSRREAAIKKIKHHYDLINRLRRMKDPSRGDIDPSYPLPLEPEEKVEFYSIHWYDIDLHNSHVAIFYRFGLIGFISYFLLVLFSIVRLIPSVKMGDSISIFFLTFLVWYLVISFFNVILEGPFLGAPFWIMNGLIFAQTSLAKKNSSPVDTHE